jgi:hypothetical protein
MAIKLNEIEYRKALQEKAKRLRQKQTHNDIYLPTEGELFKAKALRDTMFPQQRAFFDDPATRKIGFCTRRAGKTIGTALHIAATMLENPRALIMYMAQTRDACKLYIWEELRALTLKYELPFEFNENSLWMRHTRGRGICTFKGAADNAREMDKLRGPKWFTVILDESGTFGKGMEDMVLSAIGPALRDQDGTLVLIGTAGRKQEGLFYRAAHGQIKRPDGTPVYKLHKWSLQDNPYLPADARDLELIKIEEGLTDDDPRFLREYKMIWASSDSERVWSGYRTGFNDFEGDLPEGHAWQHLLGMDFGWQDASAIAVIAYAPTSKPVYVRETWSRNHAFADEIAKEIFRLRAKYGARRMIGDIGGQGKLFQQQLARDYQLFVEPAKKLEKYAYIEFMNSAFLRGDLMVAKNDPVGGEFRQVAWNDTRTEIAAHEDDNRAHAAMYGWRAAKFAGAGKSSSAEKPGKPNLNDSALRDKLALLNAKPAEETAWWDHGTNSEGIRKSAAPISGAWRSVFEDS